MYRVCTGRVYLRGYGRRVYTEVHLPRVHRRAYAGKIHLPRYTGGHIGRVIPTQGG